MNGHIKIDLIVNEFFDNRNIETVFDGLLAKIKQEKRQENEPIQEAIFEVVESTLLTDQRCSGHECFFNRTGVRCIICKNQEND